MTIKSSLSALVLSFSLLFSVTTAFAGIDDVGPFDGVECIGGGEQPFCVQEIFGQYQVTNNDLAPVFAFGVTNLAVSPTAADREFWQSFSMTSNDWDDGFSVTINGNDFITNELGSFVDLFGADEAVNFYYIQIANSSSEISINETDDNFFFGLSAASETAAFGANGSVLFTSQSSVAAVPEPETYAMLLVGLGLLGFAKRREQS